MGTKITLKRLQTMAELPPNYCVLLVHKPFYFWSCSQAATKRKKNCSQV